MKRNFRLTKANDFKKVKAEGLTQKSTYAVLVYTRNNLAYSRVAVVASKKIGNAVTRNRTKRVMRACISNVWREIHPGWDIIVYARQAGSAAKYSELHNTIEEMLKSANLIK